MSLFPLRPLVLLRLKPAYPVPVLPIFAQNDVLEKHSDSVLAYARLLLHWLH